MAQFPGIWVEAGDTWINAQVGEGRERGVGVVVVAIQPDLCVYETAVLCELFANNVIFPNLWLYKHNYSNIFNI